MPRTLADTECRMSGIGCCCIDVRLPQCLPQCRTSDKTAIRLLHSLLMVWLCVASFPSDDGLGDSALRAVVLGFVTAAPSACACQEQSLEVKTRLGPTHRACMAKGDMATEHRTPFLALDGTSNPNSYAPILHHHVNDNACGISGGEIDRLPRIIRSTCVLPPKGISADGRGSQSQSQGSDIACILAHQELHSCVWLYDRRLGVRKISNSC